MRLVRGFWSLLVGIKDFMVLVFMLIFFGLLFAALSLRPNPALPGSGALLIAIDGSLVEQPAEADPLAALSGRGPDLRQYRLRDVIRALRTAAADSRIKAVVLDLDRFAGGGQATIGEAAAAIDAVRAAGKPVLAFASGYGDDSYLLAAHASEVWLDPFGSVLLTGPGGSRLYYKGLLDKLGVSVNVFRVGRFKSAVEPFTSMQQSPEARAANQALADTLWRGWLGDVAKARPAAKIAPYLADPRAAIAAAGGDIAKAALGAGLVDRIGDRIAFGRRVAEITGPSSDGRADGFAHVPLDNYLAANGEAGAGDPIGVVTIAGEIVDGLAAPGTAGGETISKLILDELQKKRIRALVVRVDSPGGSVAASERIRGAILTAKAQGLPVVVSMGSVAASGGYWVSTPADRIFAEPSTITGSIGVFALIPSFQGTLGKLGVGVDGVKTTPFSGEPDPYRGPSPEASALIQLGVDDVYRRFTGLVAQSRKLTPARVDEIGQGRVWAGVTARQLGLVDAFGSLDDAIADAARRAKLDPAKVRPLYIERPPNPFLALLRDAMRQDDSGEEARDPWSRLAARPNQLLAAAIGDAHRIAAGPAIQVRCLECPGPAATQSPPRALQTILREVLGL